MGGRKNWDRGTGVRWVEEGGNVYELWNGGKEVEDGGKRSGKDGGRKSEKSIGRGVKRVEERGKRL